MKITFDLAGKVYQLEVSIAELTILQNEPKLYTEVEKLLQKEVTK